MKLAIMQPYFFPYIGYWQLICAVDTFVIYDDVNYIKKGYINRNSILVEQKAKMFTLELIGASQNKLIKEITVGNNSSKILKTIKQSYSKAPEFKSVYTLIESILKNKEKNIAKFLGNSIQLISNYLEIKTDIIYSSDLKKDNTLKGEDKIISINKSLNANTYINAIGGQSLYSRVAFESNGIDLFFLETKPMKYKQFQNSFIPNLSIIDVLMFNSKEKARKLLRGYRII